jgi:RNA polymerase sigma-70 factor (ECF subfamily)
MTSSDGPQDLDRFRSYLLVLARTGLNTKLRSKVDPSDVVQQTLLKAHAALDRLDANTTAEVVAWLRQILRRNLANLGRDFTRAKRDVRRELGTPEDVDARLEALLVAGGPSPSRQVDGAEQLVRLATALHRLPDAQREAVELRYLAGLPLADIAGQMGKTAPAVAGLLHRGLAALRELLQEPEPP